MEEIKETETNLSEEEKERIENSSYEALLRIWRFAPLGDPRFQGERGKFFSKVMFRKKEELGAQGVVQASKNVGWDKP